MPRTPANVQPGHGQEQRRTMSNDQLVAKVWNYAHVLRDQGISYGDYIEQITYLLFLKMDQERTEYLAEESAIPSEWNWAALVKHDGEALER